MPSVSSYADPASMLSSKFHTVSVSELVGASVKSSDELLSNQSGGSHGYPHYESGSDANLLVSPLVVAGIVIGLVLFLSCMTIIVGSFRKDSRLRNSNIRAEASYAPDAFSFGESIGELRSTCIEDYPPVFDFDSYTETLSQVNVMYQDSPPHYEDCVRDAGPGMYLPEDDPPPYSLTDPWQRPAPRLPSERESAVLESGDRTDGPAMAPESQQEAVSSVSTTSLPSAQAPPYERVARRGRDVALPMIPQAELKETAGEGRSLARTIV
ncbi:protein BEAN1 isoform X3 [Mobula hypostoma]|uniref:protein BEAN1 isoform X3 n=1 Tax=Mobula hypostoma TaxID=723540 RepID=UPI002FC2B3A4